METKYRTHYVSDAKSCIGKEVTVAGWAHEIRDIGKLKFVLLRDRTGIIQVLGKPGMVPDDVIAKMAVQKETVLSIRGTVKESKIAPGGIELVPSSIEILNHVEGKVPFDITEKVPPEIDFRLDHRYVDLRRAEPSAIFKIKSEISFAFRDKLRSLGFMEINPTCIVGAATEGGTDVFKIQYFEKDAYLAQSPQLYKQMAVVGGLDRVFMTTPVFRAEKHNTTSHLNEVLQMDIEMGFADHEDAMSVLEQVSLNVLSHVKKTCPAELETLHAPITVPDEVPRYTYTELFDKLAANGFKIEWGDDFSREAEAELIKDLKHELFFIHKWPTKVRAFYSMPDSQNEEICNAFDLMYKGTEIASGAQRIHIPELLVKALQKRGLEPRNFDFYVNAFKTGAPPHAGWSIGLERIAMKMCNQHNIRECALFPRDRTRTTP